MPVTPYDMLNYVKDNNWESEFLTMIALHKNNYSIGEIGDKRFIVRDGICKLTSKVFSLNLEIEDQDIINAINSGIYITAFISRLNDKYNIHFLVHKYFENKKTEFEEEITKEVVEYMILKTIISLRLDSEYKIDKYLKS